MGLGPGSVPGPTEAQLMEKGAPSSPWQWGCAGLRGLPGALAWGVLGAVQHWAVGEGAQPGCALCWQELCARLSRAGAVGGSPGAVRASACSFAGGDAFLCF